MPSLCHLSLPFAAKNPSGLFSSSPWISLYLFTLRNPTESVLSCGLGFIFCLNCGHLESCAFMMKVKVAIVEISNVVYSYKQLYNFKVICFLVTGATTYNTVRQSLPKLYLPTYFFPDAMQNSKCNVNFIFLFFAYDMS